MSDQLVPAGRVPNQPTAYGEPQPPAWQDSRPAQPTPEPSPIERPLAALRRYKWLMVVIILISGGVGVVITRIVRPQYEVRATIMIPSPGDEKSGPIRTGGLLNSGPDDWTTLLKSFAITDAVVRKLSLYVQPADVRDSLLFKNFEVSDRGFAAARYELLVDKSRRRWVLSNQITGVVGDSGTFADSIGYKLGLRWQLPRSELTGTGQRRIKFTVATPRETSVALIPRLSAKRPNESNFMILSLDDENPKLAADIMNTWVNEYVSVAAELKKRKLVEFARMLDEQLRTSKGALAADESALSGFKVSTITEPGEGTAIAAGLSETNDPVYKAFFSLKIEYEDIKHDVRELEGVINAVARDSVPGDAFLQVPSVASGMAAQTLRQALTDYHTTESKLASERINFTDEHPTVKALLATLNTLKTQTIPRAANEALTTLKAREVNDKVRIDSSTINLQKIPQRTIEEERLRRNRDVDAALYTNLQNRSAEAQLTAASTTPDVTVLDSAVAPLEPSKNTAIRVLLLALVAGVGSAIGIAIMLDRIDKRLRYPEQATDDLGLPIAGAIPRFPKGGIDQHSPEQMFQLVESFRTLRMTVLQASPQGVSVAVTSPSPSEGKSLISANLAMSFADAGLRTVLVDGDTRRGALQQMFGLNITPGLTDYLADRAQLSDVLRSTSNDMLFMIPGGTRQRRSPELLTSPRLAQLVRDLRSQFDVVIFDTPPMAAGIDGYSIAAAAGSLLVVLRVGHTQRRMAGEKLRMFDRLPVDVIGAVLNGVEFRGGYAYYGYIPGYDAVDEKTDVEVAAGTAVAEVANTR